MTEETIPETGPGSAAGLRWFVSCRYPNINILVRLFQEKTTSSKAVKRLAADFHSMAKPNSLQGNGKREKGNWDGTDMNDSGKWGIYGPIMDPGPEPEDGFKDGPIEYTADGVKKTMKLKAEKKAENREIIDHLRSIDHYKQTQQNNVAAIDSRLVELTWDPVPFSGNMAGVVSRGRPAIGKDGVNDAAVNAAPTDARSAPPAVKVPTLGRPKVAA